MPYHLDRRSFLGSAAVALAARPLSGQNQDTECRASATAWPQFKGDAARTGNNPAATLTLPLRRVLGCRFPAPIYASPAAVGERVYVQDARGLLACIDAARRQVVWTAALGGHTNCSSPAVCGGRVYVGSTAGTFHVLDAASGAELRRVSAGGPVAASPALANGAVYFSTLGGRLVKLDLDGKEVWSFTGGQTSITELAVRGTTIAFFAGTSNTIQYLVSDQGDCYTILQKRPSSEQTCPTSGPAFVSENDYAYQCFDSEFGTFFVSDRILTIDVQNTRGVPSLRGRRLYRGDQCWDLDAIDTSKLKKHPQQGGLLARPLWRADPQALYDGGFHSSPALAEQHLVIGTEGGRLLAFELGGEERLRRPVAEFATTRAGRPNGGISSSPAVVAGRVYFGGEDGILYGLGDGPEADIIDVPGPRTVAAARLTGQEWPTPGGDAGFSFVAPASPVKPPFRVKWRTRLWDTFKCPMIVADSKVFCGGRGGLLAALDAADGAVLWKTHHPGVESRSAPTYADGKLFILRVQCGQGDSPHVIGASGGPPGQGLWCHDAATGETVWHRAMPFAYHFNVDGLAVSAGKVVCCETDDAGQVHALALTADTGKEAWKMRLDGVTPGKNRPLRFAGVLAQGVWCLAVKGWGKSAGLTCGLDPASGKLLWRRDDIGLGIRSRLGARRDVVVVFDKATAHALDPKTGETRWTGKGRDASGGDTYGMQPLTDDFLDSRGERLLPVSGCHNPVSLNGLVYCHDTRARYSSNWLLAKDGQTIVWQHPFLSNACPAPSPGYDRLYYAPNAEGVIYCFENAG